MNNKICFIGFFPDYETYFFQEVSISGMEVAIFNPLDITNNIKYFKKLPRFIRNIWHKKIIIKYIQSQPTAHFIFNEHRLLLQGICDYLQSQQQTSQASFNGYLLLRNPLSDNPKIQPHIKTLQQYSVKILTFDKGDSTQYGFETYPQFASLIPSMQNIATTCDFSFIGRDKGRGKHLQTLSEQLQSAGYTSEFDIRQPTDSNLTYLQYLEQSLQAKCMVEILQDGQSGMTLRAIEAMLYGRKLLTNNQSIVHEPFYHPDKVMVFNGKDIDLVQLKNFMNNDYKTIDNIVMTKYSTTSVVRNILMEK